MAAEHTFRSTLLNTVLKLEEHGIRDRNLWRLQALVANRLARIERG